ncbi:MAG: putative isomerase YddE [Phycisphaerae bacterium]|nr:putative isomerase YddE [Phycisphaerae bacterium]
MAKLSYYLIDVFTAERYAGNPAAVVLNADGLTIEQMQAIAREFNLSETTFVMKSSSPDAPIRLRWFTPRCEVQMCGHGTIAAVRALIESGRFVSLPDEKGTILPLQINSGILTIRCERLDKMPDQPFLVWLDLEPPVLKKKLIIPRLWSEYLDVPVDGYDDALPAMQSQDGDVLVFVKRLTDLLAAMPDFKKLAKFSQQQQFRGICLATTSTLTPTIHVQSRFFAPSVGINEDPVTGSVHGPLAAYLVTNGVIPTFGDTAILNATQSDSSGRAGLIRAVVIRRPDEAFRVRIAGQTSLVMEGQLYV